MKSSWHGPIALALTLAALAVLFLTLVGVAVNGTIDRSAMRQAQFANGGTAFAFAPPRWLPLRTDRTGAGEASSLRLFEDGRPLGPAHSLHIDISALGGGRFSHWNGTVFFSTSDNSDPRTNGRSYTYADTARLPFGSLIAGLLSLAGGLWFGRQTFRVAIGRVPKATPSAAILLIVVSMLWLFQLLLAAQQDVSHEDVFIIIGYCLVAVAVQALILLFAGRHTALVFAVFGLVNTYSLNFVFSADMTTLSAYAQAGFLLAIGVLYFVFGKILLQSPALRGLIVAVAMLCALGIGVAALMPIVATPTVSRDVKYLGTREVKFERRPNVYFLGFDAMVPGRLADKLLGIRHPPYIDVVEKHEGHILRNLFADRIWTTHFWGATMNILPPRDSQKTALGIEPSTLLGTFLRNGYDTHFSFWTSYFGPNKGPFLTTYDVAYPYTTCDFLGDLPKRHGFLGYCMLEPVVFDRSAEKRMSDARIDLFFLERLRAAIRAGASKPQFFAAHYTRPGHTPLEYRNSPPELRAFQSYYRKSSDSAAIMLDKMLTEIRAGDPTAIVFVFGDHGSGVSRGLEYSDNPEFVVQDRHGILGAVFGTETCLPYLRPPGDERFQTSSRAVAALLQCLAGGESPLSMAYDFGRIQQVPNEMRFENYVYE